MKHAGTGDVEYSPRDKANKTLSGIFDLVQPGQADLARHLWLATGACWCSSCSRWTGTRTTGEIGAAGVRPRFRFVGSPDDEWS